MRRLNLGRALLLVAMLAAPRTEAAEILHDPDAIRACLCLDQAVTTLSAALYAAEQDRDAQKSALDALEARADAARRSTDPADLAQREALGKLLAERDAAIRRFAAETTPHYNATVARYNAAAEAFNRGCGGKAYDWSVLPDVQAHLACDAPK